MESININTGEISISITRNGENAGSISFNPADILFAEKFYKLISEFDGKMKEYQSRSEQIELSTETDKNGLPVNFQDRLTLLKESTTFIRDRIDNLFGAGTSQIAFGDALGLDMFSQFFNGITPYIRKTREVKIEKYTTPASAKRNRRK